MLICRYDKILVNMVTYTVVCGALIRSKHKHKHKNNLFLNFKVHLEHV